MTAAELEKIDSILALTSWLKVTADEKGIFLLRPQSLSKVMDEEELGYYLHQLQGKRVLLVSRKPVPGLYSPDAEYEVYHLQALENFDLYRKEIQVKRLEAAKRLTDKNLVRVLDILLDVKEELEAAPNHTVKIPVLPAKMRFASIFPADTPSLQDEFMRKRRDLCLFLKTVGVFTKAVFVAPRELFSESSGSMEITVSPVAFNDYLQWVGQQDDIRKNEPAYYKKEATVNPSRIDDLQYAMKNPKLALDQAQAQLERRYAATINGDEKSFFLGVADYVRCITDSELLNSIVGLTIIKERDDWKKRWDKLAEKAIAELDYVYDKARKYIDENKISFDQLDHHLNEYEAVVAGRLTSSQTMPVSRFHHLRRIIEDLEADHKEFVKEYTTPNEDGVNLRWNFSKSFEEFEELDKRFQHAMKISAWGSWNDLVLAFLASIKSFETLDEYKSQSGKWFEGMNFAGLVGEMNQIINLIHKDRVHFIQTHYIHHLKTVHNYLLDQFAVAYQVFEDRQQTTVGLPEKLNDDGPAQGATKIKKSPTQVDAKTHISNFSLDDEGLRYKQDLVLKALASERKNSNGMPVKSVRRRLIEIFFAHRKESLGSESVVNYGNSLTMTYLSAETKAEDVYRELRRLKSDIKKSQSRKIIHLEESKKGRGKQLQLVLVDDTPTIK